VNRWSRPIATLVAAAVAGFLIWLAAQVGDETTGGYWATYGIIAGAGVVLALSQWRGRGGNLPGMFLVAFLPVLIAAGWVLLAAQPDGNWFRDHVLAWSSDIGIRDVVRDLAEYVSVLAFGVGLVFGLTFEPAVLRRRRPAEVERRPAPTPAAPLTPTRAPASARTPADEPTAAERREVGDEPAVERDPERTEVVRR
jgi:hypothetical protein